MQYGWCIGLGKCFSPGGMDIEKVTVVFSYITLLVVDKGIVQLSNYKVSGVSAR